MMEPIKYSMLGVMWTDLAEFLSDQTKKRDISWRQASMAAGLDHDAISRYVRGTQPSYESCIKLARFFNVPESVVLKLAGHEDGSLDEEKIRSDALRQLEQLASQLPEEEIEKLVALAKAMQITEKENEHA